MDAAIISKSNWMRYVNCAKTEKHENVVAMQFRGEIFYRAVEDLVPRQEMYIWYGPEYANDLRLLDDEPSPPPAPPTQCAAGKNPKSRQKSQKSSTKRLEVWKYRCEKCGVRSKIES